MAVESTKTAALRSRRAGHMDPESKKQLGGKQPNAKKGFHLKGMETGNLKVLHLNTPFCITLLNVVQKELALVSYNRKACLRPWFRKCSNERCWWTISNFREMPKSTKTPFIYCNACCIRLLYLDNLAFWLSAMEVASKPATVAFRIAQQTIHICWNIWNPVRTNSDVGLIFIISRFAVSHIFNVFNPTPVEQLCCLFIRMMNFSKTLQQFMRSIMMQSCVALGWCLAL